MYTKMLWLIWIAVLELGLLNEVIGDENYLYLLNHVSRTRDSIKFDQVLLGALAKDTNEKLLKNITDDRTAVLPVTKKYLAVLLSLNVNALNDYVSIILKELSHFPYKELIAKLNVILKRLSDRKEFELKFLLLTWWIFVHDDRELQYNIARLDNYTHMDLHKIDSYLELLKNYENKSRNIEHETEDVIKSIKFDGSKEFKELVRTFSDSISKHLVDDLPGSKEEDYRRAKKRRKNRHILTDFMVDFFGTLLQYEADRLLQLFEIMEVEFKNYKYAGSKFGELLTDDNMKKIYNNFIKDFGTSYSSIKTNIERCKRGLEENDPQFMETVLAKVIVLLDKTYEQSHQNEFDEILQQLNKYKTEDIDIQTKIKNTLRAVLFNHISNMDLKNKLQFGKAFISATGQSTKPNERKARKRKRTKKKKEVMISSGETTTSIRRFHMLRPRRRRLRISSEQSLETDLDI